MSSLCLMLIKSSWLNSSSELAFLTAEDHGNTHLSSVEAMILIEGVTNFIQPYLHQFFDDSHGFNGIWKPLKRPFN